MSKIETWPTYNCLMHRQYRRLKFNIEHYSRLVRLWMTDKFKTGVLLPSASLTCKSDSNRYCLAHSWIVSFGYESRPNLLSNALPISLLWQQLNSLVNAHCKIQSSPTFLDINKLSVIAKLQVFFSSQISQELQFLPLLLTVKLPWSVD